MKKAFIISLLFCASCGTTPIDASLLPNEADEPNSASNENTYMPKESDIENSTNEQSNETFRQLLTAGSRLSISTVTGEDGSISQEGFFDSQYKAPCFIQRSTDGNRRCLPFQYLTISPNLFSDPQCSRQVYYANNSTEFNSSMPYCVYSQDLSCGVKYTAYQGAVPLSKNSLYTDEKYFSTTPTSSNFSCNTFNPNSYAFKGPCYSFYSGGSVIPANKFVLFR